MGAREQGEEATRPQAPQGLINVSFFRDGHWVTTEIDDRLPCSRSGELLAPHCEIYDEGTSKPWMALAEKAFAAVIGGYDKFEASADLPSALVQLTGGQVQTVDLTSDVSRIWLQNGYLWSILKSWVDRSGPSSCIVVCLTHHSSKERYGYSDGLARNLAYAVVGIGESKQGRGPHGSGRLVRICNPWGPSAQWRGSMANGSPELESLRLKEDAHTSLERERGMSSSSSSTSAARGGAGSSADGSSFWMTFEDWADHFSTVHVCKLLPGQWHSVSSKMHGPCKDAAFRFKRKWLHNPAEWGGVFNVAMLHEDASLILSLSLLQARDVVSAGDPLPKGAKVHVGLVVLKAEALTEARRPSFRHIITAVRSVWTLVDIAVPAAEGVQCQWCHKMMRH